MFEFHPSPNSAFCLQKWVFVTFYTRKHCFFSQKHVCALNTFKKLRDSIDVINTFFVVLDPDYPTIQAKNHSFSNKNYF